MDAVTTETQNLGYVLIHNNIHPIYDLLMHSGGGGGWGDAPADPELQNLNNIRPQKDVQKESQWGPSIDDVAETKGLEPDQWFFAMSTCM